MKHETTVVMNKDAFIRFKKDPDFYDPFQAAEHAGVLYEDDAFEPMSLPLLRKLKKTAVDMGQKQTRVSIIANRLSVYDNDSVMTLSGGAVLFKDCRLDFSGKVYVNPWNRYSFIDTYIAPEVVFVDQDGNKLTPGELKSMPTDQEFALLSIGVCITVLVFIRDESANLIEKFYNWVLDVTNSRIIYLCRVTDSNIKFI